MSVTPQPKIQLHLGDPGITLMHRAGIAGLWMTLEQLQREYPDPSSREGNLTWSLTARRVSLDWEGQDLEVLDWLLKQSFRISDEGLISLTGLNPGQMDLQTRITVHQGIRGTFVQHPSAFKSAGEETRSLQIDPDSPEIVVNYKKARSYAHQDFAKKLCDKKGNLSTKPIAVAGWLNPGATVRHVAFSNQTGFEEPPKRALALVFAPVACQYFILRSRLRDKRAQYALIVPEVVDLETYTRRRRQFSNFGYKNFCASGLGDAGLKFLTHETTLELAKRNRVERCQTIVFGTVAWSSQQKTRTDIETVAASQTVFRNYQLSKSYLSDRVVEGQSGNFIARSFARELIADNLALGLSWFHGISEKVNSQELFQRLAYEREGLHQMTQNAEWDDNLQQLFVQACHEALRRTYAQIYERTREGEHAQIDRERERIRTGLGRCKNSETFRQFITDFWSRAGRIPVLQEHWQDLLPMVTGKERWKEARDLALLALASYRRDPSSNPPESDDEEVLD
jgi:CRISPR-associated protein Cas8a1/Csx13